MYFALGGPCLNRVCMRKIVSGVSRLENEILVIIVLQPCIGPTCSETSLYPINHAKAGFLFCQSSIELLLSIDLSPTKLLAAGIGPKG